ncbi:MAG TPA: transferrin receptor-like dimerization domain-containing protein, partial [Cyclobacteriaceae bacterium]|nr:transferrin receptor-like dimerization domain-containing protein [Cyclobacteriaceae bacterium]
VLPVSYHDAEPMLKALKGQVCPESWRGALPFTYYTGPGPARVRLNLEFNWDIKPAYNIIATLEGARYPDQWIIRGNHHDAWVNGAADPVSGLASLMEEARIIGHLARQGYVPVRTIIYCAWDAEEPGLIGSTEWVEDHKDELNEKAVLYINTDGLERGFLYAAGSHSLTSFMESVAASVTDPQTNVSVLERWNASQIVRVGREKFKGFQLGALGSGSDFTPFIQHLGISSLNISFGGEGDGGEYHSIYDSYNHFTRFKDPGFLYCGTLTRITGHAVLRFANSDVLPFDFTEMDSTLESYTKDIMDFAANKKKENDEVSYRVRNNLYKIAADPKKAYHSPKLRKDVPFLNFAPIQNALSSLGRNALQWKKINADSLTNEQLAAYNRLVFLAERKFILPEGLPGRAWYKHALYAPGVLTGYDVKIMPGIREALENEDWDLAQEQINVLAGKFVEYSEFLEQIISSVGE